MTRPDDERDAAAFAEIVAQLQSEPWPEPEQSDASSDGAPDAAGSAPPPADPVAALPSQWRMPTGDSSSILDDADEAGFVPPDPQPLPSGDLHFWGALIGLIGGPLWLLYLFLFDRYARPIWWVLACALAVGGLVLIFLRQPQRRGDDWNDDVDGAVL